MDITQRHQRTRLFICPCENPRHDTQEHADFVDAFFVVWYEPQDLAKAERIAERRGFPGMRALYKVCSMCNTMCMRMES